MASNSLTSLDTVESVHTIGVSCKKCQFPVDKCDCVYLDSLCTDCVLPMNICMCNIICNACGVHPQDCTCPEEMPCEKCRSYKCECKLLVEKFGHCPICMNPPEYCSEKCKKQDVYNNRDNAKEEYDDEYFEKEQNKRHGW